MKVEYQVPPNRVPRPSTVASYLPATDRDKFVEATNSQREMFMVSDLAKSGLTYEDISAKLTSDGYMIPYLGINGKPIVDQHGRAFMFRVKLFTPGPKGQKYDQPGSNEVGELSTHPYIPPESFDNDSDVVYICEGEKKAACAAKYLKARTIGIGGCHSWGIKGSINPFILALLRQWKPAKVVLVPDGDVRRYDINAAYGTFRQKLQIEEFDATILDMPKGHKLDDLLWRQDDPVGWLAGLSTFTDLVENPAQLAEEYGLSFKERGPANNRTKEVPANESNLYRLLTRHPAFPAFWFDLDKKYVMQEGEMLKEGRHDFDILTTFQHRFQLHAAKMGPSTAAVGRAAFENERSPFLEWVKSQQWDGKERLSRWLVDYCGAEDTEYARQLGRRWMVAAVARMAEPGCIVDYMLITKGPQGIGKSSLPTILFGPDNVIAIEGGDSQHKDLLAKMHLGLCANMEELSIMGSKDISALKPTITNRIDAFRRPFKRDTVQEPRRFVIYGSTDKQFSLPDDPAGHRRFPIVEISYVRFAELERDRGQLWAEAALAYERGEPYSNIDDVSENVQKFVRRDPLLEAFDNMVEDIWANERHGWRATYRGGLVIAVTSEEVCRALDIPVMGGKSWASSAIKEHMVQTGWTNTENGPTRQDNVRLRRCWILTRS